jgi:uncharacterized protein YmfQ (DUF2313 family)
MSTVLHTEILARLLPPVAYAAMGESVQAELRSAAALLDDAWQTSLTLRTEADPRSTYDLLEEFEQAYGLPDLCGELELTVAGRRLSVVAKLAELGGQTPFYFEQIAVALGYPDAQVVEYLPTTCEDPCVYALAGAGWRNAWSIASNSPTRVTYLDCEGPCTEPFENWSLIEVLQCVINRLKPAHTVCYFDFGS